MILSYEITPTKITLSFDLTPVRMVKINNINNNPRWNVDVENKKHLFIAGESINLYRHYGNQFGGTSGSWG